MVFGTFSRYPVCFHLLSEPGGIYSSTTAKSSRGNNIWASRSTTSVTFQWL